MVLSSMWTAPCESCGATIRLELLVRVLAREVVGAGRRRQRIEFVCRPCATARGFDWRELDRDPGAMWQHKGL